MVNRFFVSLLLLTLLASCRQKREQPNDLFSLSPVIWLKDTNAFSSQWSDQNILVAHITSDPDNLHPSNGNSGTRSEIFFQTQAYLFLTDFEKQSLSPSLLKSLPEISANGLEYIYTLLEEPKWDDGTLLSVDDILFTAKAHKCQLTNNPVAKPYWHNLKSIRNDSANDRKFTMIMKTHNIQDINFISNFAIMQRAFHDPQNVLRNYSIEQFDDTNFKAEKITSLTSWAKEFNSDKYGRIPELLNGLGMYKVLHWEPGQSITLVRKQNHWTEKHSNPRYAAYPEKIIYKINRDENSVQLEIKAQTLDVSTNLSMGSFYSLASNSSVTENYHAALSPTYNYSYLAFNKRPSDSNRKKLFDDVRVRKAIAHLTPVEDLMKLVYKEYSKYGQRMISNVSPLKPEFHSGLKPLGLDSAKARELLTASGWTDTDKDGVLDKEVDGIRTSFSAELLYLNTGSDWRDMALLISEQYAKAGIRLEPRAVDLRVFLESARSHNFDMLLSSWGGTALTEDFTQLWHSTSWKNQGSNYSGFGSEQSDVLIEAINQEADFEKRKALSMQFQEMIYEDQPYVFLFCSMRRNLVHKRFGNVALYADRPGIILNSLKLLSIAYE